VRQRATTHIEAKEIISEREQKSDVLSTSPYRGCIETRRKSFDIRRDESYYVSYVSRQEGSHSIFERMRATMYPMRLKVGGSCPIWARGVFWA